MMRSRPSLNRTIMELKLGKGGVKSGINKGLNRTIMELKFVCDIENVDHVSVLIVPLWN